MEDKMTELDKQIKIKEKYLSDISVKTATLRSENRGLKAETDEHIHELDQMNTDLENLRNSYSEKMAEKDRLEKSLIELEKLNNELNKKNGELKSEQKILEGDISSKRKELEDLKIDIKRRTESIEADTKRYEEFKASIETAYANCREYKEELDIQAAEINKWKRTMANKTKAGLINGSN